MIIYDVQVNHLNNPLGHLMSRICFSWKVKECRGKRQKCARVMISLDENMEKVIFDSGFDETANSLSYEIGFDLLPKTRYYYTVTVCTDADETAVSNVHWFETAKRGESWLASWITCDNDEKRHPIFSKEILPSKPVSKARLYICGLGLYEAYFNGKKIGGEYLTPYCSNYNKWVQYQTYDITESLQKGGTLSVLLGNGWYKGRFGFDAHEDNGFYGNDWKLIAEVVLTYSDGAEEIIGTDESWTVTRSNITFSNFYDGEHRDDTLPVLLPEKAILCDAPEGKLTERLSTPVTVHEEMKPVELLHTPKDEAVLDMGQEFAGIFRLKVDVPKGVEVVIKTGEVLQNSCFYNDNLRTAKSEYRYISNGAPTVIEPHFTYYGYRYVKIEGIPDLKKEDFTGITLYSDIPQRGDIETGSSLVNKLISNVRWGLKSNFLDVPTDCPQRDERMGWTGDAQVFSSTALYLQDAYAFYAKYLYDMYQEQLSLGGKVPDVVPSFGYETCACVWGDAACIIPWNLYKFYGDISILKDQFESMKAWVDYVRQIDGNGHEWGKRFHYGDWLALDNPSGGADQVLGGTDEEFIANIYYAASADITAKTARLLGKEKEAEEYGALSEKQFEYVKKEYYSVTGRCCIKTQTALLLTLKYHLSENKDLIRKQLRKLFSDNNNKLNTGFVGTPMMCGILSDNGLSELAYKLLLNEEYPGWLHEIKLGATTVWERWNSLDENGNISSTGMNSLDHYSYGAVVQWIFDHCAGIQQKEAGFKKAFIAPQLNYQLKYLKSYYDSPAGKYTSEWGVTDKEHVHFVFSVPFDCEAEIVLPYISELELEGLAEKLHGKTENGHLTVGAGEYDFSYETVKPIKPEYSCANTSVNELMGIKGVREAISGIVILETLPKQYLDYSLMEINKQFGGNLTDDQLKEIDKILLNF